LENLKLFAALCAALQEDGLSRGPFALMAYAWAWIVPDVSYDEILDDYAGYVGDAPERVHADLCYRLLKAGKEIGPEEYLLELIRRVAEVDSCKGELIED